MRILLFAVSILLFLQSKAQIKSEAEVHAQAQRDSIVSELCRHLKLNRDREDSIRIELAYQAHLYPYLDKQLEEEVEDIGMNIFLRLQRNCKEFKQILDRLEPLVGDWKVLNEKPKTRLDRESCRQFLEHREYRYTDSSGDTTRLIIDNGYWTDYFKDGTTSKLEFRWLSDCEFEIEFIESNNYFRMNYSKPGDIYRYVVIDQKDGYYDMGAELVESEQYMRWKLYY